jgi:hypothetical protein
METKDELQTPPEDTGETKEKKTIKKKTTKAQHRKAFKLKQKRRKKSKIQEVIKIKKGGSNKSKILWWNGEEKWDDGNPNKTASEAFLVSVNLPYKNREGKRLYYHTNIGLKKGECWMGHTQEEFEAVGEWGPKNKNPKNSMCALNTSNIKQLKDEMYKRMALYTGEEKDNMKEMKKEVFESFNDIKKDMGIKKPKYQDEFITPKDGKPFVPYKEPEFEKDTEEMSDRLAEQEYDKIMELPNKISENREEARQLCTKIIDYYAPKLMIRSITSIINPRTGIYKGFNSLKVLHMLIDRYVPAYKSIESPVKVDVPDDATVSQRADKITKAMMAGEISPTQANTMVNTLNTSNQAKAGEVIDQILDAETITDEETIEYNKLDNPIEENKDGDL